MTPPPDPPAARVAAAALADLRMGDLRARLLGRGAADAAPRPIELF